MADIPDIPKIPDVPDVIDNLVSPSTTDALSANQGRVLKSLIDSSSSIKYASGKRSVSGNGVLVTFTFSPTFIIITLLDSELTTTYRFNDSCATILLLQNSSIKYIDDSGGNRTFTLNNSTLSTNWQSIGFNMYMNYIAIKL